MYLQWVFLGERYEQGSLRLGKEELLSIKTRSLKTQLAQQLDALRGK